MDAYGREAMVLPNGISMDGRPASAAPPGAPLRLVAVGRFNPQKNFPWMMHALGGVPEPWRLTLIGDGAQAGEIKEAARAAGIMDRVDFCGWVTEERLREVLAGSDVLLAPSTSEGNPLAVIEALKQGVAILASDTPGLSDLVEDGKNGVAVAVAGPEPFRRGLRRMLSDAEAVGRMKRHSLEMSSRFDIAQVAGQFEELLERACRKA
jgi:glycosyltransferase involved in cell wall biosynthesis